MRTFPISETSELPVFPILRAIRKRSNVKNESFRKFMCIRPLMSSSTAYKNFFYPLNIALQCSTTVSSSNMIVSEWGFMITIQFFNACIFVPLNGFVVNLTVNHVNAAQTGRTTISTSFLTYFHCSGIENHIKIIVHR